MDSIHTRTISPFAPVKHAAVMVVMWSCTSGSIDSTAVNSPVSAGLVTTGERVCARIALNGSDDAIAVMRVSTPFEVRRTDLNSSSVRPLSDRVHAASSLAAGLTTSSCGSAFTARSNRSPDVILTIVSSCSGDRGTISGRSKLLNVFNTLSAKLLEFFWIRSAISFVLPTILSLNHPIGVVIGCCMYCGGDARKTRRLCYIITRLAYYFYCLPISETAPNSTRQSSRSRQSRAHQTCAAAHTRPLHPRRTQCHWGSRQSS